MTAGLGPLRSSNAFEVTKITYGSSFLQQFKFEKFKDAASHSILFVF